MKTKITAKQITNTSYILITEDKEKLGILVDYSESESLNGFELFMKGSRLKFNSLLDFENTMNFELQIQEKTTSIEQTRTLGDYPVNDTESVLYIEEDPILGISTFRKSERSKKRFYPGWWIVSKSGVATPRLTISVDTYNDPQNTVLGPYKTYMEVTYNIKKV